MNAGRWNQSIFELGRNPLEDPVVTIWDALMRGQPVTEGSIDTADAALIASFIASDRTSTPSASFVDHLGQQLAQIAARDRSASPGSLSTAPPVGAEMTRTVPPRAPSRTDARRWPGWLSSPAVAALLALILAGGIFVGSLALSSSPGEPPAIPAANNIQTDDSLTTFSALFDPADFGLPDQSSWNSMMLTLFQFLPGESFDTNQGWFTSTDGFALIQVQSGTLKVNPSGSAVLYRDGSAQQSVPVPAGTAVTLETEDTLMYSIRDGAVVSNASDLPALVLHGQTGKDVPGTTGSSRFPLGNAEGNVVKNWTASTGEMHIARSGGARLSFQRLTLRPQQASELDIGENAQYLGVAVDAATQQRRALITYSMAAQGTPDPETIVSQTALDTSALHTTSVALTNAGEEPIVVYLFRIEYLDSGPAPRATPVAAISYQAVSPKTLLSKRVASAAWRLPAIAVSSGGRPLALEARRGQSFDPGLRWIMSTGRPTFLHSSNRSPGVQVLSAESCGAA